jgi:hypothetical protein
VAAAYAALDDKRREATQALILAAAAWIPALALLLVLLVNMRAFRAMRYIQKCLHPKVEKLAEDADLLAFELQNREHFEQGIQEGAERMKRPEKWFIKVGLANTLSTNIPVIVLITLASIALGAFGVIRGLQLDVIAPVLVGLPALITASMLACASLAFAEATHPLAAGWLRRSRR